MNLTLPASPADGVWVDVVNTSGTTTVRILRNAQNPPLTREQADAVLNTPVADIDNLATRKLYF